MFFHVKTDFCYLWIILLIMKKHTLIIAFWLFVVSFAFGQSDYQLRTIAFYNVENLFDTVDDPEKNDEASPIMQIESDRAAIYKQKLDNMAKVLSEIGNEASTDSPVIIGLAEVENHKVIEDLINTYWLKSQDYGIIHYDSPDERGIDVALIYQRQAFRPVDHEIFELKLWDENGQRDFTRDQLLVTGYLDDELLHIIVNHWPSRRGGPEKSNFKREKAAYVTTRILDKLFTRDPNAKVIVMGDLNDDPTDSSLKNVLKAKSHKATLQPGNLYNPMEDMFRRGFNTLVYRDQINLFDQILLTSSLITSGNEYESYKMYRAGIYNPQYLTTQTGKYKGYPFRSFASGRFIGGYSDHYPVYIQLARNRKSP